MKDVFGTVKTANWVVITACLIVGIGLWIVFGNKLPPQIPLLYTKPWGEAQLVKPIWLLGLPVAASLLGLGLAWLGIKLKKELPLAVIVLGTSMVIQVVITLAILRIIVFII